MAPPFSIQFIENAPGTTPTALITQDSNGLLIKSPVGQKLWDTAQTHLSELPNSGRIPASLYLRFASGTGGRDHGRTYCTARVPGQDIKYLYKFWLGIGEWVITSIGAPNRHTPQHAELISQSPSDGFYGRKLVPISLDVLWGLDSLLKYSWHHNHSYACSSEHYDIYINVMSAESNSQDPLEGLLLGGPKRFTYLQACADAKVESLFQNLIGFERSTGWDSLSHCLTEVHHPCGVGDKIRLGRKYSFGSVRDNGTTMKETGWFETKSCVALVSSMHLQLNLKARNAFLFD